MKKVKQDQTKFWVIGIVARHPETRRIHFSFLSFHALNKHQCMLEVIDRLPLNPELLDSSGSLIPFSYLDIKSVPEKDSNKYLEEFVAMFSALFEAKVTFIK